VAECIVQLLEVIEVDVRDANGLSGTARSRQFPFACLRKTASIQRACQGIDARRIARFGQLRFKFGDPQLGGQQFEHSGFTNHGFR
jgi:hypothetical protein